ncbi:MAG: cupin domain-containing protein [Candidatus Baldrarchaeia archaeon]
MISGQLLIICNDKKFVLNPGDVIHIPPGVQHSAKKNTANEPAILIVINSPPQD